MKHSLSPRELAQTLGVSESSIKRWADEGLITVSRTAGGHRRILLPEALRFIRSSGLAVVEPSALGLPELTAVQGGPEGSRERDASLLKNLINGNGTAVRGLVVAMYMAGHSVAEICDGPLTAAMHHIGDLWNHDQAGVFIEHRATDLCIGALHQLRLLLPERPQGAAVATGGALSGDTYTIPSLMAATVLAAEGYQEVNLGPQTPAHVLALAAVRLEAALAWVTFSVREPDVAPEPQVREVASQLAETGTHVVLGGRGCPRMSGLGTHVHQAASMSQLAAFARGLVSGVAAGRPDR